MAIKPAPQTPRTTLRLAELFAKAGAPAGLVQAVTGGAGIGQALVTDPGVDMVSVTGSTESGRAAMSGAAATLKRVHLELGGKAPALAFEDADLAEMARGVAIGATYNEALQVATTRLPETVRVLREAGEGAQTPEAPSVGANTRDEIGEVARAFDEVHREAIRLAGDEAKLRANVNAMFVNLSRHSQTLVMMPDMLITNGAGMPQQDGQYEAFTSFDANMFDQPSTNGSGPRSPQPMNPADRVVDTQWPGSIPAPGTGNWPSFGDQPVFGGAAGRRQRRSSSSGTSRRGADVLHDVGIPRHFPAKSGVSGDHPAGRNVRSVPEIRPLRQPLRCGPGA